MQVTQQMTSKKQLSINEDKIRTIVEEPIMLDHGAVGVGVSLGWAVFPQDGEDSKALLKTADIRMFETKKIRKAAR